MSEPIKHEFKTDVKELLHLVTHALYSNKEIFIRELISNASDAIDKIRFEALTNTDLLEDKAPEWRIDIALDPKAKTLTLSDNGCGMNEQDLLDNLGTIAKSGTKAFMQKIKGGAASTDQMDFIGQFGVGFYSSFIVANQVVVRTRKAREHALQWTSDGAGDFAIEPITKLSRGTDIILHLKDEEFLDEFKVRGIIKKYSDYIAHPIYLKVEGEKAADAPEPVNSRTAIWLKSPNEVKPEEYEEFYKHVARDFQAPLKHLHFRAEGTLEFKALIYFPARAPMDLYSPEMNSGLQLYVNRVFIMEDCKKLIPPYLRFLKGVVDCADLSLNVSRELIQEDPLLDKVKKNLIRKVLNVLGDWLEKDREAYLKFYQEFGKVLKEGLYFDMDNRDKLSELLLFETTTTNPGEYRSLKDYVAKMSENQKEIVYLLGDDKRVLMASPQLEQFRQHNIEVLLLTDQVDQWVVNYLTEFDKKPIKSASDADVALPDDEQQKSRADVAKTKAKELKDLLSAITKVLEADVSEVRFSSRLTESFACLVAEKGSMNAQMEQMMRAMGQNIPKQKKVLELNPAHTVVQKLESLRASGNETQFAQVANLLFDLALVAEGGQARDIASFTQNVSHLVLS